MDEFTQLAPLYVGSVVLAMVAGLLLGVSIGCGYAMWQRAGLRARISELTREVADAQHAVTLARESEVTQVIERVRA